MTPTRLAEIEQKLNRTLFQHGCYAEVLELVAEVRVCIEPSGTYFDAESRERDIATTAKCTKIVLEGGTSDTDRKFLDIAPTPQSITHQGRRYFRCPQSQCQDPSDGEWAMMYLWDGWGEWRLKQKKAEESK